MSRKLGVLVTLCCSVLFAQSGTTSADSSPGTPRVLPTKSSAVFLNVAGSPEQPATKALLFSSERDLWVVNSDGSGLKQLLHFKDEVRTPYWSPDGNRIAFVKLRHLENDSLLHPNVWVMNSDGSGAMPLTSVPKTSFDILAWSPDGHSIVAASHRGDLDGNNQFKYESSDILLVNADGSGTKPILQLNDPNIFFQSISWSPDGRKIALQLNRRLDGNDPYKGMTNNIWVMDADGSHVIPLTRFTGGQPWIWGEMVWSPDSRRIAYASNRALDGSDAGGAGGMNIWVSNADGSGSSPLTRLKHVTCRSLNWSPDGSRLIFASTQSLDGSDSDYNVNIWTIKRDGSAPVPLTHETKFERSNDRPALSPDGSTIAYVSCIQPTSAKIVPSTVCKLSIMNADGTAARQLTEQNVGVFQWLR